MPMYRVTIKALYQADIYADNEDDAWTAAEDIDLEDCKCADYETLHVRQLGD